MPFPNAFGKKGVAGMKDVAGGRAQCYLPVADRYYLLLYFLADGTTDKQT